MVIDLVADEHLGALNLGSDVSDMPSTDVPTVASRSGLIDGHAALSVNSYAAPNLRSHSASAYQNHLKFVFDMSGVVLPVRLKISYSSLPIAEEFSCELKRERVRGFRVPEPVLLGNGEG